MSLFKLVVPLLITYYLAADCAAKKAHSHAAESHPTESSRSAFGFIGNAVGNALHPKTKPPSDLMETVTKLAALTKTDVDAVAGTITGLIEQAKAVQLKTRAFAQKRIDSIVSRTATMSQRLGAGPGCVAEHMAKAGALVLQTGLDEVDCAGTKIVQLENMLEDAIEGGQIGLKLGPLAILEHDECQKKGGLLIGLCEAKIPLALATRAATAASRLATAARKAVTFAKTIEPSLMKCAKTKIAEAKAKASELVGKFGACSKKTKVAVSRRVHAL